MNKTKNCMANEINSKIDDIEFSLKKYNARVLHTNITSLLLLLLSSNNHLFLLLLGSLWRATITQSVKLMGPWCLIGVLLVLSATAGDSTNKIIIPQIGGHNGISDGGNTLNANIGGIGGGTTVVSGNAVVVAGGVGGGGGVPSSALNSKFFRCNARRTFLYKLFKFLFFALPKTFFHRERKHIYLNQGITAAQIQICTLFAVNVFFCCTFFAHFHWHSLFLVFVC